MICKKEDQPFNLKDTCNIGDSEIYSRNVSPKIGIIKISQFLVFLLNYAWSNTISFLILRYLTAVCYLVLISKHLVPVVMSFNFKTNCVFPVKNTDSELSFLDSSFISTTYHLSVYCKLFKLFMPQIIMRIFIIPTSGVVVKIEWAIFKGCE